MRCDETRRKLNELSSAGSDPAVDRELQDHLRECPACAREAQAAEVLRKDFADARVDDNVDQMPWAVFQSRVETQATLAGRTRQKEKRFMTALTDQIKRRPRIGMGVALIAATLLVATLVPFTYDRTIGYEVAFAGVNRDLAMDNDKINDMLAKLGVADALVDVSDCEATCLVTIRELDSPAEAKLVVTAFEGIDDVEVVEELKPIHVHESGNLVFIARAKIAEGHLEALTDEVAHQIVIELLGQEAHDGNLIWVEKGEGGRHHISFDSLDDSGCILMGDHDGVATFYVRPDGQHDEHTVQSIVTKHVASKPDGHIVVEISTLAGDSGCDETKLREITELAAEKDAVESELPEGHALSQNYPNPFNPTTTITYSLPGSQHVTLEVLNIQGQLVRTLVNEVVGAGEHSIEWDATADAGNKVASGIYLYRLTAGEVTDTKKMIFTK
jgi:hypothetical protein